MRIKMGPANDYEIGRKPPFLKAGGEYDVSDAVGKAICKATVDLPGGRAAKKATLVGIDAAAAEKKPVKK